MKRANQLERLKRALLTQNNIVHLLLSTNYEGKNVGIAKEMIDFAIAKSNALMAKVAALEPAKPPPPVIVPPAPAMEVPLPMPPAPPAVDLNQAVPGKA